MSFDEIYYSAILVFDDDGFFMRNDFKED